MEGEGSPKADIVREVAWIYSYRSDQNADKGGGGQKSRKFCGRPLWTVPFEVFRPQMYLKSRICYLISTLFLFYK